MRSSYLRLPRLVTPGHQLREGFRMISNSSIRQLDDKTRQLLDSGKLFPKPYFHPLKIKKILNNQPMTVLELLGVEVNQELSSPKEIRVGSRGSLRINTDLESTGRWYNFETGTYGDMLDLVGIVREVPNDKLYDYVVELIMPELSEQSEINHVEQRETFSKEDNENKHVAKIISELQPIDNTIVEQYLGKRGITNVETSNLKYHPKLTTKNRVGKQTTTGYLRNIPGMVALATNPQSDSVNLQITYLDHKTGYKHKNVQVPKRVLGSFSDSNGHYHCCHLTEKKTTKFTFVTEGVETGLSIYQAFPDDQVIATLGKSNFSNLDPQLVNENVILILDNDGKAGYNKDKVFRKTAKRLLEAGLRVHVVFPDLLDGSDKTDMNDILIDGGEIAVYEMVVGTMKSVVL